MRVISVINYKGGVGKTTVTANLAAELAFRGQNVLLLDMDPQCSLTFSFLRPDEWEAELKESKTIKNWFDSIVDGNEQIGLDDLITTPVRVQGSLRDEGGIDIISSHLGLINVDLELATQVGGGSLQQSKRNYLRVHGRLADALRNVQQADYDLVLIDCPPNFNITTKNAIVASDGILIPAKPDYLSTLGIDYLKRSLTELVSEFNEYSHLDGDSEVTEISPEIIGVVFTMIQVSSGVPINAQKPFIHQTKMLGVPTFKNFFRENKSIFGESPQYGVPVVLNRYTNQSHKLVVEEIEGFVNEFEEKIEGPY